MQQPVSAKINFINQRNIAKSKAIIASDFERVLKLIRASWIGGATDLSYLDYTIFDLINTAKFSWHSFAHIFDQVDKNRYYLQ